jgi:putative phage-type endonuclease
MSDSHSVIAFLNSIPQYPQRSTEWFEQRKTKLTSSDVATVLGLNPNKEAIEVLFDKCGLGKEFVSNDAIEHGQKYEDEAIEKYCYLMGKKSHSYGMFKYTDLNSKRSVSDPALDFLGGSPDGVAEDINELEEPILLEVKCPLRRKIEHGEIPVYYYPQLQLNMLIMNLNVSDYIEYVPGSRFRNEELNIVRVYKNDEWLNKHIPKLIEFWASVIHWREKGAINHPLYKEKKVPKVLKVSKMLFIPDTDDEKYIKFDMDDPVF